MERELLFTLKVLRVSGKKRVCITTSFKEAIQLMHELKSYSIKIDSQINVYTNGFERVRIPEEEQMVIYFATLLDYQEALKTAKRNKWISLPPEFLYDKKYHNLNFAYSAKRKGISVSSSLTSIYLKEELADVFFSATPELCPSVSPFVDGQQTNYCLFEETGAVLGCGGVAPLLYGVQDFKSVVTDLKNNLCKSSFMQLFKIRYFLDGTVALDEANMYLFRKEFRVSAIQALRLSNNRKSVVNMVNRGVKEFIYDKCTERFFEVPQQAKFVAVNAIDQWSYI